MLRHHLVALATCIFQKLLMILHVMVLKKHLLHLQDKRCNDATENLILALEIVVDIAQSDA